MFVSSILRSATRGLPAAGLRVRPTAQLQKVSRRLLSSGPSDGTDSIASLRKYYRKYKPQLIVVGAGVVVVYGISKIMFSVTGALLGLDMYDVFYLGFCSGLAAFSTFSIGGLYLRRKMNLPVRKAFQLALQSVAQHPQARTLLGAQVIPGPLKAFRMYKGHVSVTSKEGWWVEPRVQLMFTVVGDKGDGVVTAEVAKKDGQLALSAVALDAAPRGTSEGSKLVMVEGTEAALHVAGNLRGFLQLPLHVQYVAQDRVDPEVAASDKEFNQGAQ